MTAHAAAVAGLDAPATPPTCRLQVQRETDVPQVVAAAHQFCTAHGLSALAAAHVATAASELANNLWMHAQHGGCVSLRWLDMPQRSGVELCASDDGPGIADLALAMQEGWSSGGGMGCGLPGVQRLMDDFCVQSAPGQGTVVRAHKWRVSSGAAARAARLLR